MQKILHAEHRHVITAVRLDAAEIEGELRWALHREGGRAALEDDHWVSEEVDLPGNVHGLRRQVRVAQTARAGAIGNKTDRGGAVLDSGRGRVDADAQCSAGG